MLPSKQWLVVMCLVFVVIGTIIALSRNAEESLRAEVADLQSQLEEANRQFAATKAQAEFEIKAMSAELENARKALSAFAEERRIRVEELTRRALEHHKRLLAEERKRKGRGGPEPDFLIFPPPLNTAPRADAPRPPTKDPTKK